MRLIVLLLTSSLLLIGCTSEPQPSIEDLHRELSLYYIAFGGDTMFVASPPSTAGAESVAGRYLDWEQYAGEPPSIAADVLYLAANSPPHHRARLPTGHEYAIEAIEAVQHEWRRQFPGDEWPNPVSVSVRFEGLDLVLVAMELIGVPTSFADQEYDESFELHLRQGSVAGERIDLGSISCILFPGTNIFLVRDGNVTVTWQAESPLTRELLVRIGVGADTYAVVHGPSPLELSIDEIRPDPDSDLTISASTLDPAVAAAQEVLLRIQFTYGLVRHTDGADPEQRQVC